jgi:tRNA(Ser,Leu) C12 N-acetylase TAN1
MESKTHVFTYPEDRLVYKEMPEAKAEVFLPEYVANTIKECAEVLDAEVSIRMWWPYVYIFIEKDISKQVDDCFDIAWSKAERDALSDCEERCGDDEKCHDECIDVWKHDIYNTCTEDVVDDIRPSITKTINELENIFKIYGIEADVEAEWNHDIIEIRARLKGYSEIIPIEIGKTIFTYIVNTSMAKTYTNIEKFAYAITSSLVRYYGFEGLVKLIKNIDMNKIYISRIYDEYEDENGKVRKYEITVEYNEDKIRFYLTEEKKKDNWIITNVMVGSILSPIADLTPA